MFVLVVVVFNLLVTALSARYSLYADLTQDHIYSISQLTTDFLDRLDKDVDIYILNNEQSFVAEGEYYYQAAEVIKRYGEYSDRVTVTFVDYMKNPGFSTRYPNLALNTVLVVCGDDDRILYPDDLFNLYEMDETFVLMLSSRAEQTLTGALVSLTSDEITQVAVSTGHNESLTYGLIEQLVLNNFQVSQVRLVSQPLPEETAMVVIAAPQTDFTQEELRVLDDFLYNDGAYGRTVFYMAGIDQQETPYLDAFLAEWGIAQGEGYVFETDRNLLGGAYPNLTVAGYAEEQYARVVLRSGLGIYMPNARPLEILENSGATVTPLLEYSENAGIRSPDTYTNTYWEPSTGEICGPIPALILSAKSDPDRADSPASYVLAAATSLGVDTDILAMTNYSNARYYVTLLSTLTGREDVLVIEPKQIGGSYLGITYGQAFVWGGVFLVALPLTTFAAGAVVFIRRRHR